MNNEIIYRIENEYLILDYYFDNKKISSTNAGCIIDILNQVKLYNEEYNTLIEQNKHMMDISKNYEQLQQENEELKKLLEEKTKIGVADHKYASQCEDKVITMEAQQQEFIKYLEDEIEKQKSEIFEKTLISEDIDIYIMRVKLSKLEEILTKYKKIIGVSDEKVSN